MVRRHQEGIPADKTGPFSIAAFRERLRPFREELRDAVSQQLPDFPRLAGLKCYTAAFWQQGLKGAMFKGYIWNFLAANHAKTRARLQATFTPEQKIRTEYVAYPALDPTLRYDITGIAASLRKEETFALFRGIVPTLPRGFFLSCRTGAGTQVDEYVDEIPETIWDKLRADGISEDEYFLIGTDRPRNRLAHLNVVEMAAVQLTDLSELTAIRDLLDGKAGDQARVGPRTESAVGRARRASAPAPKGTYTPEFSGTKTYAQPGSRVEADCRHGLVVDALAVALTKLKFPYGNDQLRDLYILREDGSLRVLFEVKTDLSTSSIYAAIGQLMLHGAAEKTLPVMVAVLPGNPEARTAAALAKLGVRTMIYELAETVTFPDLEGLLRNAIQ